MKLVHIVDFYQIFRKCDKTELDMQYTHKSKTIHILNGSNEKGPLIVRFSNSFSNVNVKSLQTMQFPKK